jgi:hypothetical protein
VWGVDVGRGGIKGVPETEAAGGERDTTLAVDTDGKVLPAEEGIDLRPEVFDMILVESTFRASVRHRGSEPDVYPTGEGYGVRRLDAGGGRGLSFWTTSEGVETELMLLGLVSPAGTATSGPAPSLVELCIGEWRLCQI